MFQVLVWVLPPQSSCQGPNPENSCQIPPLKVLVRVPPLKVLVRVPPLKVLVRVASHPRNFLSLLTPWKWWPLKILVKSHPRKFLLGSHPRKFLLGSHPWLEKSRVRCGWCWEGPPQLLLLQQYLSNVWKYTFHRFLAAWQQPSAWGNQVKESGTYLIS